MHTLWVLVLWFGFDSGGAAMQTVEHFPDNQSCMNALTVVKLSSSGLIHGTCVEVVVPK